MEMYASDRFLKAYRKASLGIQNLAEGAIHDFIRRYRSDPRTVSHNYDRLANISQSVLEIDLSGANRLLAVYTEDQLVMIDMGGHEIVSRYTSDKLVHDLLNRQEAPRQFWPETASDFFVSIQDRTVPFHYPDEISADWLYFLEEEQESTMTEIFVGITEALRKDDVQPAHYFIIGGPGTGKTCILLSLLKHFTEEGFHTGIHISNELLSYVELSTKTNIRKFHTQLARDITTMPRDILLVDDPESIDQINLGLLRTKIGMLKAVVVALDPLQLNKSMSDNEFALLVERYGATAFALKSCYRQKENVGGASKHVADVVATSTPYLNKQKIETYREERKQLTELANDLIFLNPHGYAHYYENAKRNNLQEEVERILQADWMLWKHWPGLLVIEGVGLPSSWVEALAPLYSRNYVKNIAITDLLEIKGLEFQHVFVVLSQEMFNEVQNGFKGSGRKTYDNRRLMRIPFSRAKDSLVTFVIDEG